MKIYDISQEVFSCQVYPGDPALEREITFRLLLMAFSDNPSCIDFLGIHPQYRKQDIQKLFLDVLLETYLPGKEISMTTYREGDRADTGHRELLKNLGFAEKELMIE